MINMIECGVEYRRKRRIITGKYAEYVIDTKGFARAISSTVRGDIASLPYIERRKILKKEADAIKDLYDKRILKNERTFWAKVNYIWCRIKTIFSS